MPVTLGGAVRHKKLFVGKKVKVLGSEELAARVLEVQGDSLTVRLSERIPEGRQLPQQGEQVSLVFVVPGDASYRFAAVVNSSDEPGGVLQLSQAEPIVRTDQRNDYRLQTSKIIYVADVSAKHGLDENWQQAGLLDISRGGASFITPLQVMTDEKLKVWIPLDEVDHILEVETQVVRIAPGDDGLLTVGVNFFDLSLADQGKLLDYIMEVWRKKKNQQQPEE